MSTNPYNPFSTPAASPPQQQITAQPPQQQQQQAPVEANWSAVQKKVNWR